MAERRDWFYVQQRKNFVEKLIGLAKQVLDGDLEADEFRSQLDQAFFETTVGRNYEARMDC